MKKILALLLVILMVASMSACGKKQENPNLNLNYEIGDTGGLEVPFGNGEEIRIVGVNETNSEEQYIFEKLSEITGLKIVPELLHVSTAGQRVKVLLAGGNLPDIFGSGVGTLDETNDLAMQGAFAAVNDYMDIMPNFRRFFGEGTENHWVFKSLAAADGKLYLTPTYKPTGPRIVNHGMLYRKDIFDKEGIKMWNSPETFYEVLKELKTLYPNSYPLTSKTGVQIIGGYATSWGLVGYSPYYDEEEETWKYSDIDPKMKDMLDFFRQLYVEGILDPEFLTNTQAAWTQKMTSGNSFVTFDWIGRLDMFKEQTADSNPDFDLRYGNPVGPKQTLITLADVGVGGGPVIANNKNTELSMKLSDFLYSDAGAELMTCGVRGETFEIDENGMARYLEFPEDKKIDIMDLREKYGMWMAGTYRRIDERSCYAQFSEREQEAQEYHEKINGFEPADPPVTFSGETSKKIIDYKTNLSKKFEEVMFKYILGTETGDAAWEKWVTEAKRMGADEYINLYNTRHQELGL